MKRYAIITTTTDRDNVAAYLPANYRVIYSEPSREPYARPEWKSVVIGGEDNAGWTLDGYVLPRLASGMLHGREIDLSHDIMKRVPDRPAMTVEITLPDGTVARWQWESPDEATIDRLTCAIENVIGRADTIIT
jgi:hypothetical protein